MAIEIPRGPWTMPDWMRPYIGCFNNLGTYPSPEEVEKLYNGKTLIMINAPLALIECCVHSQVEMLTALHKAGMLK